jgi:hypothetical protein
MTTMKAVRIRSFGGPEVLELAEVEKPTAKDDEVLIRVRAASVNPVDYKIRSSHRFHPGQGGPPDGLRDPSYGRCPLGRVGVSFCATRGKGGQPGNFPLP